MVSIRSRFLRVDYVHLAISLIEFAVGKWVVTEANVTCLVVQMDIKVNFTYTTAGKRLVIFAKTSFLRSKFAKLTIFASFTTMSHLIISFIRSKHIEGSLVCNPGERDVGRCRWKPLQR